MENFQLKKCFVLLEKIPTEHRSFVNHDWSNLQKRTSNKKAKSSKTSKKRLFEEDESSVVKAAQVKRFKVDDCEINTTKEVTLSCENHLINRSVPSTYTTEEIEALINSHKLLTIQMIFPKEKLETPINTQKLLTTSLKKSPILPNIQNKNITSTNGLKELNESINKNYEVEKISEKNTLGNLNKEIIENFDETNKEDLTVSAAVTEIKENNQNNSNLCQRGKNLNEENFVQENPQAGLFVNQSIKLEVEVKESSTRGLCFSNIEEQKTRRDILNGNKSEELTSNKYLEQSMQLKENTEINYKIVKPVINKTEVRHINKTKQEHTANRSSVKDRIDTKYLKYYSCSFSHEKFNKNKVKIIKQNESKLLKQAKKVEKGIQSKTKIILNLQSKLIARNFEMLSRSEKINNDRNYIPINFYYSSSETLSKLSHNTILNKVRSVYMFYFSRAIEPWLDSLSSTLLSAARMLCYGFNKTEIKTSHEIDIYLKDYSALFVQTFKSVQCQFFEVHRSLMTTVLYMKLFNKAALIKPGTLKSVVARLFRIENYKNSYDNISNNSKKNAKTILGFFNSWLGKVLIDPILKIDGNKLSDFSLNCKDKINNSVDCNEKSQKRIAVMENVQLVDFHSRLNEIQNDHDLSTNTEREMILDLDNSHNTEENQEDKSFQIHILDGITGEDCSNVTSCNKKKIVPCLFCYELVCCSDFCEVQEDQLVFISSDKNDLVTCITCKQHKSFSWSEEIYKVWNEAKDHPMPYNPICWNVTCNKRATVVCLCKTKAYCSLDCQVEDWEDIHSDNCSRKTHPDLLWNLIE